MLVEVPEAPCFRLRAASGRAWGLGVLWELGVSLSPAPSSCSPRAGSTPPAVAAPAAASASSAPVAEPAPSGGGCAVAACASASTGSSAVFAASVAASSAVSARCAGGVRGRLFSLPLLAVFILRRRGNSVPWLLNRGCRDARALPNLAELAPFCHHQVAEKASKNPSRGEFKRKVPKRGGRVKLTHQLTPTPSSSSGVVVGCLLPLPLEARLPPREDRSPEPQPSCRRRPWRVVAASFFTITLLVLHGASEGGDAGGVLAAAGGDLLEVRFRWRAPRGTREACRGASASRGIAFVGV